MLASRFRGAALAAVAVLTLAAGPPNRRPEPRPATQPAFDVSEKSIAELQAALGEGRVTSRALVEAYITRIRAYDQAGPATNAFISLNPHALDTADALDRERRERGPRGPLHGIPLAIKDNFDTADMPTTGASVALATHRPSRDAYQVERLRAAGAIVIGKTNLHELAAGIVSVSSLGGQTRNPYDPARNPGGSSGGTGAAVAASLAAAGLGTDTCGSIRIPAAHNNLVGLRPTMGLSSRAGVIPLALTQDVAGPLGRTVADVAALLDATVGYDPRDPVTEASRGHIPASYAAALADASLDGARVGVLSSLFGTEGADAEVAGLVRAAIDRMREAGAVVSEVTVPDLAELTRGSSVIDYEFKFDLADYLAASPAPPVRSLGEILERGLHHEALTATFRRRNATESRDSEPYRAVLARRETLRAAVLRAMDESGVEALAYPTMRRKAARIGEPTGPSNCQLSASTGLPALAVPAAFTSDGLPIGLELLGRAFSEVRLLRIGAAFERAVPVRRPPPATPGLARPVPEWDGPPEIPAGQPALDATFQWDPARGVLGYSVRVLGVAPDDILVGALRQGPDGPIVGRLVRPGRIAGAGEIILSDADQARLKAGTLVAQIFTRQQPLGGPSTPVTPRIASTFFRASGRNAASAPPRE